MTVTKETPDYDAYFTSLKRWQLVQGTVAQVDHDGVWLEIGPAKSEAWIPDNELTPRGSTEQFEKGAVMDAVIIELEDDEGRVCASRNRARAEVAWRDLEASHESGESMTGKVVEAVRGGLIIDVGVRAFMPASQVDVRRVSDLNQFVGQTIEGKVVEFNRIRKNVVLSRRELLEVGIKEERSRALERLQPGMVVRGTVSNVVDFGVFVELGGVDGLVHISELSWEHVDHPSSIVQLGQSIDVKVLEVDRERSRVSLGLKQLTDPPEGYETGEE